MLREDEYFKTLTHDQLWQRYCGFLDLSLKDFMDIQRELLLDEINRVADSALGKKIIGARKPKSIAEFRSTVPLTNYDDYEPFLGERQENVLAEKPVAWSHSSGKGGRFKWIPYTKDFLDIMTKRAITGFILSTSTRKGEVNIQPGSRFLIILPPPPYASGCVYQYLAKYFSFKSMPPQETSVNMEFQERVKVGFKMALKDGIDVIASLASVLVSAGERFSGETQRVSFSWSMLYPKTVFRLLRATVRSKREKRTMLPKDIWPLRGILTGGVDIDIYRRDLAHYWGIEPFEVYGCTEAGILLAMHSWNRKGMVFFPDNVFLEFIPVNKKLPNGLNTKDHPSTVLFDELEVGQSYELVITHFYGMPLLRYRIGDIIKVIAAKDSEAGINLPHIAFGRRVGETINIGGLADLDEKNLWQAIANTGIKYKEWSARKEYADNQSILRLYLEPKEAVDATKLANLIDEQLKSIDTDYRDLDAYLGLNPIKVTLLSPGTFQRYIDEKTKEGADLAHLKPSHVNPPDAAIERLIHLSEANQTKA